jgi:hypothetical protein
VGTVVLFSYPTHAPAATHAASAQAKMDFFMSGLPGETAIIP